MTKLTLAGDCGDKPRGHPRPSPAAVREAGPEDRVPRPDGGGTGTDPPDSLAQNEHQVGPRCQSAPKFSFVLHGSILNYVVFIGHYRGKPIQRPIKIRLRNL